MLEPMKKLPTKGVAITIDAGRKRRFIGPRSKLRPLLTLIKEFDFKPISSFTDPKIPWEVLAKDKIDKYGEAALALRGARLKSGLSQKSLAEKLGIAQYNLSKMENGKRPVSKKMAQKLGRILKMDYRVFL